MSEVTLAVDGIEVTAPRGSTIMQAADQAGLRAPRLCYHPRLSIEGARRVCVVDVERLRNLVASCCYPAEEGMVVRTHAPVVPLSWAEDVLEMVRWTGD